ncbi:type VII secretion protein EccE [Plantactinospora sp. KBS50]|uniref:type VII secretion protein EccE n=1 Tax=Plantactinospora sp. KBS50 TaxID=2024580 RepID=UPI0012FDA1BE|nr:type VII secretion protein EccE [Plantactinospora sp. KBS50]
MTTPGSTRPGEPGWQQDASGLAGRPPGAAREAPGPAAGPAAPTLGGADGRTAPGWDGLGQGQGVPAQRGPASPAYPGQAGPAGRSGPAAPATTAGRSGTAGRVGVAAQPGAVGRAGAAAQAGAANRAATAPRASATATVTVAAATGTAQPGPAGPAGTAAAATASGASVRPHRFRAAVGAVHVGQLVAWQVALAAILAASRHGPMLTMSVTGVAVVLLAPTVIRRRGRWLHQWLSVWLRYRFRRHLLPATGGSQSLNLLTFVEESAEVEALDLDDQPVAVITHRGGLSVVFEVDPADGALVGGPPRALPSPAALLPARDSEAPPIAAQMLVQIAPAPRALNGPGVDRSYRELVNGDVPAQRRTWLVLQAVRTADFYLDRDLRPALISAIRRSRRQLRQSRIGARLLSRDELLAAVAYLARLPAQAETQGVYGTASERMIGRETWRGWANGDFPQSCYRMVRWPRMPWQVDPVLCQLPGVSSVVSIAATRDDGVRNRTGADVAVEVGIRLIAGNPTVLAAGDRALTAAVRTGGGRIERMDGEQVYGLAATLPFGGFLR